MIQVVILCGGKGTRLSELTGETPKPLLMVGDKPLLQHIINMYVRGGFTDFLIPVGYLGGKVREYFRENYRFCYEHEHDLSCVSENGDLHFHIVDTGFDTQTGGRLLRLREYLDGPFCMTYGDGVSRLNPRFVKELGEELNKNIVTVVHPVPRFGAVKLKENPIGLEVTEFSEKQIDSQEWINGGFMYLKPEVFQHITEDGCNFEKDVLPKLVWESGLYAFPYENYWHCCDTLRDLQQLNEDYKKGLFG